MTDNAKSSVTASEVRHRFQELGSDPWQAELHLRFNADIPPHSSEKRAANGDAAQATHGRTRLVERRHKGPLVVQRPFWPEGDPCHVYLVHPPGGVVGGDELRIDAQLDPGAHALITTPAATKFYRCEGRISSQAQELRAAGATLEWLPQENIFYRGADARTATRVHIDGAFAFHRLGDQLSRPSGSQ